jgi:hypothetical protein
MPLSAVFVNHSSIRPNHLNNGVMITGQSNLHIRKLDVSLKRTEWADLIFNAQSTALNLATTSLQGKPAILFASFPVMHGSGLLTYFSPCVWSLLLPLAMPYISTADGN